MLTSEELTGKSALHTLESPCLIFKLYMPFPARRQFKIYLRGQLRRVFDAHIALSQVYAPVDTSG